MDMRRLVGRNFARIRREKGLTQEQVEELSGFSQQYISGLEQGRRNPTVVTLYELAELWVLRHSICCEMDQMSVTCARGGGAELGLAAAGRTEQPPAAS